MIILGIIAGLFCAGLVTAICTWLIQIIVELPLPAYMACGLCGVAPLFFGGLFGSLWVGFKVAGF